MFNINEFLIARAAKYMAENRETIESVIHEKLALLNERLIQVSAKILYEHESGQVSFIRNDGKTVPATAESIAKFVDINTGIIGKFDIVGLIKSQVQNSGVALAVKNVFIQPTDGGPELLLLMNDGETQSVLISTIVPDMIDNVISGKNKLPR